MKKPVKKKTTKKKVERIEHRKGFPTKNAIASLIEEFDTEKDGFFTFTLSYYSPPSLPLISFSGERNNKKAEKFVKFLVKKGIGIDLMRPANDDKSIRGTVKLKARE
jgi:hypothetical protein